MKIEKFLNNPPASVDKEAITKHFKDKTVLVTGGAGYIGSVLCRMLFDFKVKKVIAFDIDDTRLHDLWLDMDENKSFVSYLGDIKDPTRIEELFNEYDIDIVFHASAIKHVPLAELYPKEAIKVNVIGTSNIVEAALQSVEQFINISTDKAADAIGVMGKTKKAAEQICIAYGEKEDTKVMSMRFGNIYGSRGSVVPTIKNKLKNKKPIQITDIAMERYFIKVEDAVLLTLQACTLNTGYEDIFTFDMGSPIKIWEIAEYYINKAGLADKDINIDIIGKRPGEKLKESLISRDESKIETSHPKIYRIQRNVSID